MFILTSIFVFFIYCLILNEYNLRARYRKLGEMNVRQLKACCKDNGIKGYSKLRRSQLLDTLYVHIYTK